ncbi:MAG: KAP family NTPase [Defluviitaleaceae bacterium]|nr:KAP family NTPase [Defluviitaleaceae bacterium]
MEGNAKRAESLVDIFNIFKPEALKKEQLNFYQETATARDNSLTEFYERIYYATTKAESFERSLVVGHMGCGKSTELQMLRRELSKVDIPEVYINAIEDLDLFNFTYIEILILMVEKLALYANENDLTINKKIQDSFEKTLLNRITKAYVETDTLTDIETSAEAKVPLIFLNFLAKITTQQKLTSGVKEELFKEFEAKASDIISALNALIDDLSNKTNSKFVIIIDGLEKCREEGVVKLFTQDVGFLSRIRSHMILSCPIAVYRSVGANALSGYFNAHITIPMIKTHNKDQTSFEPGIETIKSLIRKRADDSFFEDDVLNTIITKTGGNLRDATILLSRCAFEAFLRKRTTVDMESTIYTLKNFAFDTFIRIPSSSYPKAREIYEGNHDPSQDAALADLLYSGAAFEYNGDRWIDLAPLVREYIDKNPGILG